MKTAETLRGLLQQLGDGHISINIGRRGIEVVFIPDHYTPMDPDQMNSLLHASQFPEINNPLNNADTQHLNVWLNTPQNQTAREMLQTAARQLFPGGTLNQDSLHLLLNSPMMQGLLQGGKIIPGATMMLPNAQMAALSLPFLVMTEKPESGHALAFAQQILPQLMSGNVSASGLNSALQALMKSFNMNTADLGRLVQSLAQVLTSNELVGMGETQALMKAFLGSSAASSWGDKLSQWASRLMMANNPQFAGLKEFAQAAPSQGLSQIFSSVLKVLMGVLMTNPQNQWPKALPNEQMLAELGTLFAAQAEKTKEKKERRKSKQKTLSEEERLPFYYHIPEEEEEEREEETEE